MERDSEWIKPGWFVAACENCDYFCVVPNRLIRNEWANWHREESGHYIDLINGVE